MNDLNVVRLDFRLPPSEDRDLITAREVQLDLEKRTFIRLAAIRLCGLVSVEHRVTMVKHVVDNAEALWKEIQKRDL